jgi:hypothetical protein
LNGDYCASSNKQSVADPLLVKLLVQDGEIRDHSVEVIVGPADFTGGAAPAVCADHQVFLVIKPIGFKLVIPGDCDTVDKESRTIITEGEGEFVFLADFKDIFTFQPQGLVFVLEANLDVTASGDPGGQMAAGSIAAGVLGKERVVT